MLEEVLLKLEVEDVISRGFTCTTLASVVGQEKIWRVVLAKTQLVEDGMVNKVMVRKITTFLDETVSEPSSPCCTRQSTNATPPQAKGPTLRRTWQ